VGARFDDIVEIAAQAHPESERSMLEGEFLTLVEKAKELHEE
jgi:hypothetical protein